MVYLYVSYVIWLLILLVSCVWFVLVLVMDVFGVLRLVVVVGVMAIVFFMITDS